MGCDIHGWVEQNVYGDLIGIKTKVWYPVFRLDMLVERNYKYFSKLFGVRSEGIIEPLIPQRGFPIYDKFEEPEQSDRFVRIDYEALGVNAHSPTYATWNELSKFNLEKEGYSGQSVPKGWKILFSTMKQLASYKGNDGVRLVVWFDN